MICFIRHGERADLVGGEFAISLDPNPPLTEKGLM